MAKKSKPTIKLICTCCESITTGRQWRNRYTGFGICPKCAAKLTGGMAPRLMYSMFGSKGIHYAVKAPEASNQ